MKLKYLHIVFFALITSNLAAQISGYVGNRFMVSSSVSANMVLPVGTGFYNNNAIYSNTAFQARPFKLVPRFTFDVDYVVSQKTTIGLKYSFLNSDILAPRYFQFFDPSEGTLIVRNNNPIPATIKTNSIGFRITRYSQTNTPYNLPAPLGFFWGFDLGVGIATLNDENGLMLQPDGTKQKGKYITSLFPDAIWFIGIRRGIGKKIMYGLKYDVNLAYAPYILGHLFYEQNLNDKVNNFKAESLAGKVQYIENKHLNKSVYYNSYWINLTLQISFLPF